MPSYKFSLRNEDRKEVFCDVCNTNVLYDWDSHVEGKKHQRLLKNPLSRSKETAPPGAYCGICQVNVGVPENMPEHVYGQKHQRLLRKRKLPSDEVRDGHGGKREYSEEGAGSSRDMPPPRDAPRWRRDQHANSGADDGSDGDDRPPPGLRGREIGLWYAERSRRRKEQRIRDGVDVKREKEIPPMPLELGALKLNEIKKILGNLDFHRELRKITASSEVSSEASGGSKYENIKESDFKRKFLNSITGSLQEKMKEGVQTSSLTRRPVLDDNYKKELVEKHNQNRRFNEMLDFRKKLPAYEKRKTIIEGIEKNNAILISGETGCGKTTQVPQFILEHEVMSGNGSTTHIVCTQPRRISAISVAERVAVERGERLGQSIGYQIRLEKVSPRDTGSILFCTTGILLKYMQSDPLLKMASHVIIDEVHERDTLSDFVITLLKEILPVRPDLKVILMSATLNAEKFSKYLNNCPTIHIPGFTFPVREYYLEDVLQMTNFRIRPSRRESKEKVKEREEYVMPYIRSLRGDQTYDRHVIESLMHAESEEVNLDLIVELCVRICKGSPDDEAILIFLPGWDKISKLHKLMTDGRDFRSSKYRIIPLHSMMPTANQRTVFDRPPRGVRKIVIATNIAETSITIDDIVHVIDSGKIKIKNFDIESNITTLNEEWVSLANAKQRKGRAGRVQNGYCYHLFSRGREAMLLSYQLPEMLRTRLEEVILQLKILQLGKAGPFLSKVLDPPQEKSVELAIKLLEGMRALDENEDLTPLGYHLANLPVDPQAGKMLLLAAMFSCFQPVASIAACLSFKDPFLIPIGKEKEVDERKKQLAGGSKSDHLLLADILVKWEAAEESGRGWDFTKANYLSYQTLKFLKDMKEQFGRQLYEMNYLPSPEVANPKANLNSNRTGLIKAILCGGLYPNIALIMKQKRKRTGQAVVVLKTLEDGRVSLHPKSVNCNECDFKTRFLVYFEKMKSTSIFLHDTTMITPLALLFFCEKLKLTRSRNGRETIITVNEYIKFSCSHNTALLIQDLRSGLDWLLEYKIAHPGVTELDENSQALPTRILRAIIELITIEDEEVNYDAVDSITTDSDA